MAFLSRPAARAGLIALAVVLMLGRPEGQANLTEAQVKAGLLYNFATFVQWPPDPGASGSPFPICVDGADDVGDALKTLEGGTLQGQKVTVRRVRGEREGRGCRVLYIGAGSSTAIAALADVGTSPVLTVGDHPQFGRMGGIIRLYPERSRIRFEIDIAHAERAGLKISSKLLGLSRLVRNGDVVNP